MNESAHVTIKEQSTHDTTSSLSTITHHVQILGSNVTTSIIHNKVLRMQPNTLSILIPGFLIVSNEANSQIICNHGTQLVIIHRFIALLDAFDDFGGNVDAVPSVAVVGFRPLESAGDGVGIG
jgi:hypothetical protein